MQNLAAAIASVAERERDRVAVLWEDRSLVFPEVVNEAERVAGWLRRHGVRPGDRVAIGLANGPELLLAALGIVGLGAVLVPLNPSYTAEEARYVVGDAGAKLVVCEGHQGEALAAVGLQPANVVHALGRGGRFPLLRCPAAVEEPALIVYTSGTTGRPKGAVLSHRALVTNLETVRDAWRWTHEDRLLLALPCFHLHGLALGLFGSLLAGSSIIWRARFVAQDALAQMAQHRATMFFGVPTMYNRLVALPEETLRKHDLGSMRLWVCGSAPLTAATFTLFEERFGHRILERFGMSEGGFMIAAPYEGPRQAGAVGRALPGIEVRLVDAEAADSGRLVDVRDGHQGEIVVRGPNLFSGYWGRPEETKRAFIDGFFRSGDLAVRGPDGMIRITGRSSVDIIKTRGFKVSAVEIENHLQSHPSVQEVAVVGVPDPDQGERIVAVVTPSPGMTADAETLRVFAAERLAPHKVPAEIVFMEEIPRTGPGKFSKKFLISRLSR